MAWSNEGCEERRRRAKVACNVQIAYIMRKGQRKCARDVREYARSGDNVRGAGTTRIWCDSV
jgi:hypothetical protein